MGKSSLLNLISGIDVPDNGKIHIDNISVSDLSETERTIFRRKHIGFIYQFFNLIPVLTVLENITLICELDSVPLKEYKQRADYADQIFRVSGKTLIPQNRSQIQS